MQAANTSHYCLYGCRQAGRYTDSLALHYEPPDTIQSNQPEYAFSKCMNDITDTTDLLLDAANVTPLVHNMMQPASQPTLELDR